MKRAPSGIISNCILAISAVAQPVSAQLVLSGNNYIQNFDGINSGLPAGWSVRTNASATSLGVAATYNTAATSWSASSGQFANEASTTNNDGTAFTGSESSTIQSAATNRCLAVRQTGSFGDPGAAFIVQIQDTMGLANFQLGVDFNLLAVNGRTTVWTVDYGIGSAPVSFIALGSYTAYASNSSPVGVFGTTRKTFSFGSALDNQNQNVWIRMIALSGTSGSGNRDSLGVDNFTLGYTAYVASSNPPSITAQPHALTNNAGDTATFNVTATGPQPLTYRWRHNGADLSDGGNINGAFTPVLTISNVLAADAGIYTVVVANNYGTATSSNAVLGVIDPIIVTQPVSHTNVVGDTANFFISSAGTAPISYQWRLAGTNLPGETGASLNVVNVQPSSAGIYSVTVSNSQGVLTSSVVNLTLYSTPSVMLSRWNFNGTNSLSPSAPTPSTGAGTAALIGGTTATFA